MHEAVLRDDMTTHARASAPLKAHPFGFARLDRRRFVARVACKAARSRRIGGSDQLPMKVMVKRLHVDMLDEKLALHRGRHVLVHRHNRWMLMAIAACKRRRDIYVDMSALMLAVAAQARQLTVETHEPLACGQAGGGIVGAFACGLLSVKLP